MNRLIFTALMCIWILVFGVSMGTWAAQAWVNSDYLLACILGFLSWGCIAFFLSYAVEELS